MIQPVKNVKADVMDVVSFFKTPTAVPSQVTQSILRRHRASLSSAIRGTGTGRMGLLQRGI
jgi:hypothetical protein